MLQILYVIACVIINIPLFGFITWLMFDDIRESADSVFLGMLKSLSALLSMWIFFAFLLDDGDNSMLKSLVVLGACILIIVGEVALFQRLFPSIA